MYSFTFSKALDVHAITTNTAVTSMPGQQMAMFDRPLAIDSVLGEYIKSVSAGQSLDSANPQFDLGVTTILLSGSSLKLLCSPPLLSFLGACATFV